MGQTNSHGSTAPQLPEGWEVRQTSSGKIYYVDHVNKRTTWTNPSAAIESMIPSTADISASSAAALSAPSSAEALSPQVVKLLSSSSEEEQLADAGARTGSDEFDEPPCNVCDKFNGDALCATFCYESLKASALEGRCLTCSVIHKAIASLDLDSEVRIGDVITLSDASAGVSMKLELDGEITWWYDFYTAKDKPVPWKCVQAYTDISGDTASDQAKEWALRQFRRCTEIQQGHELCQYSSGNPLPNRILDLGQPANGEGCVKRDLKLYVPGSDERAAYICLSHCWGSPADSPPLQTKMANIEEHKRNIKFDSLPKSFQDAVVFTRKIQMRYLWIDSLCIIQDDPEDWRSESVKMADIFGRSALTLAAAASLNSHGGLMTQASSDERGHVIHAQHPDDVGISYEIRVRKKLIHPERIYEDRPDEDRVKGFPLLERAWVYQERLLSPRVLHFAPGELIWECESGYTCECLIFSGSELQRKRWYRDPPPKGRPNLYDEWHKVTTRYSSLKMTKTSDRLPAIAGIAKDLPLPESEYLAGLCKTNLLEDLIWHTVYPTSRPKTWRAPSWSWAAVDSIILYDSNDSGVLDDLIPLCTVLDARCTLLGPDSFGEVSAGHVVLTGPIVSLRMEQYSLGPSQTSSEQNFRINDRGCRVVVLLDYLLDSDECEDEDDENDDKESNCDGSNEDNSASMEVHCLLIGKRPNSAYGPFFALMLQRLQPSQRTYERIGLLFLKEEEHEILFKGAKETVVKIV